MQMLTVKWLAIQRLERIFNLFTGQIDMFTITDQNSILGARSYCGKSFFFSSV